MKTFISLMFSLIFVLPSFGQITYKNNCIRSGDEIIKQQVEYKDPGRSGENVIWDFSNLQSINDEYRLSYNAPYPMNDSLYILGKDTINVKDVNEEDLIVGTEHFTNYFYRVKDNQLILMGHQNPVSLLHYQPAIPVIGYPSQYKQEIKKPYESKGIHSGTEVSYFSGEVDIVNDAYGILVLPNKDTLQNVTRIKTTQTIVENRDSLEKKYIHFPDSIRNSLNITPLNSTVETYRWYVKGYRYPIFETVRNITHKDSLNSIYFETAFFYPPQEHFYLDEDAENLAVLDSLNNQQDPNTTIEVKTWLEENFSYNYYPNPVIADLNIEYNLKEDAEVGISFYNTMSGLVRTIPSKHKNKGLHTETIQCAGLFPGNYTLVFTVRGEPVSCIIVKK